jgi:hypothetical protein
MPTTLVVSLTVGIALGVVSGLVLGVPVRHLLDPGSGVTTAPSPTAGLAVSAPAVAGRELPAARVLEAWDRRRAAAYATGSPLALRAAYMRGSQAGRADLALLRAYRDRGWRVLGMHTQVLALAVVDHGPALWRLRVTDRLIGAIAVRPGERVPLPRDRPSRRVVTLTRAADGRWQVAAVRPD